MLINQLVEGVVVDTSDPQQMGRLKVWCSALDGDSYKVENLPWVRYVTPLAGQTMDYPAGSGAATPGPVSYGMWQVPKVGAEVIVGILYGDPNLRFYIGSYFPEHGNRSLPAGRNGPNENSQAQGPQSDSHDAVQPTVGNLEAQFQGNLSAPEALTRGAYERQVAQARFDKDGKEGYQKGVLEPGLDPQTYCWTTPGRHALIFQDHPETARTRLKTANGHQIILDDANERIYISTCKGQNYIELDQDGRVHIYAADSISVTAAGDFNLSAKGNINLQAGKSINLSASDSFKLSACKDVSISSDKAINIASQANFDILGKATLKLTSPALNLNGAPALPGPCADKPDVVPEHEPWSRPGSKYARGSTWKP